MGQRARKLHTALCMVSTWLMFFGFFAVAQQPAAQQPVPSGQPLVDKLILDNTIQSVSSDELSRAIARA